MVECPLECFKDQGPDFVERNGTFLLTVFGMITACVGGMFTYFLKSRCTTIKCLGFRCDRKPLEGTEVEVTSSNEKDHGTSSGA